jgi:hypothetical protein
MVLELSGRQLLGIVMTPTDEWAIALGGFLGYPLRSSTPFEATM